MLFFKFTQFPQVLGGQPYHESAQPTGGQESLQYGNQMV